MFHRKRIYAPLAGELDSTSKDPCVIAKSDAFDKCAQALWTGDEADVAACGGAVGAAASIGCKFEANQQQVISKVLGSSSTTTVVPTTTGGGVTKAGPETTNPLAVPCSSREVIEDVQRLIGVDADGKWGPKSQAALGNRSFQSFAPDCTPPVPHYSAKTGTTTKAAEVVKADQITTKYAGPAPVAAGGKTELPWDKIAIGAVAVGVVAAVVYALKK